MAISLPGVDLKRQLARKLFDAVISEIPLVGGPYSAMLSVTHPSELEQFHAVWQSDITEAVNQMETIIEQLVPTIALSDKATEIGTWISQNSENGRRVSIDFEKVSGQFSNATKLEVEDACGELEYADLVTLSGSLGHKIVGVRPEITLFEVFDPIAFDGANPRADAAHLGLYILAKDQTVGADEMMLHFDWSVRRFNPAISIVCSMIGAGRKSAELHPTIACRYVMPSSQERAALRRFAKIVLGAETESSAALNRSN